jgi:CubicO group peptidase (beta-lactamase class C family)
MKSRRAPSHPNRSVTRARRWPVAVAVAAATVLTLVPGAAADKSAPQARSPAAAFVEQLDAAGIPGGALVTVTADGTLEARGVGTTGDGEPVRADTSFVIGSTTKSFTALAVMLLVEAGRVGLDDPVTQYVPELQLAPGEPVDSITVRHLLQHTSGLDDLTGGPVLGSALEATALEAVAELQHSRLASTPGDTWRYANANYVLAGLVVERASGTTYADFVQERILDPLRMTDTHVLSSEAVAPGHRYWFGVPTTSGPVQREGIAAAGYIASSARDLSRYLAMYLRGGTGLDGTRIISAAGIRALTAPGPEAHLGPWADGAAARYAMGWMVGGPWAADAVFHPGNSPDSSAMIALFPARGLAAAVLVPASHELPVPGNPSLTDRISRNTLHAVLGEPVPAATSLWGLYAVFDLVIALLLGLAVWSLVRAANAARRPTGSARALRRWLRPLPSTLATVLLLLLPSLPSYGWRGLWTWAPDLTTAVLVLALVTGATAVVRVTTAVRESRRGRVDRVTSSPERVQPAPPAARSAP